MRVDTRSSASNKANKPKYGENLRITVAANQGGRRYMEDRVVVKTVRKPDGSLNYTFLGVFDGHGGEHASEFVRQNLFDNITQNPKFDSDVDDDILEAIREGFLKTHETMRDVHEDWPFTASGYPSTAGTTVSCVFIRNGKLYTGHVGDSAIYLGLARDGGAYAEPLTIDHKPESSREQQRILKAGGSTAIKSGVTRVVWRRPIKGYQRGPIRRNTPTETIPFLSVARSLGDLWSFCEATGDYIVSPDPDVDVHELTEKDFCLILASDGLTNVLTASQAVSIVWKEEELVELQSDVNRNHARCLLQTALNHWRTLRADNVTVATVIFDHEIVATESSEVLMRLGSYTSTDQVMSERPDAMLQVTHNSSSLLCTDRVPIIYSGAKDVNFCKVAYRGPGFKTHEEEILDEQMYIRKALDQQQRNGVVVSRELQDDDDIEVEYDDDAFEEIDVTIPSASEAIHLTVAKEVRLRGSAIGINDSMNIDVVSPMRPRPATPRSLSPAAASSSIGKVPTTPPVVLAPCATREMDAEEGTDEEETVTSSILTPTKKVDTTAEMPLTTGGRLKASACRRLRTPKMTISSPSKTTPARTLDRRLTRSSSSATHNSVHSEIKSDKKGVGATSAGMVSPKRRGKMPMEVFEAMESPSKKKSTERTTPSGSGHKENEGERTMALRTRSSTRLLVMKTNSSPVGMSTPHISNKMQQTSESATLQTQSRKRGRYGMISVDKNDGDFNATGITPIVAHLAIDNARGGGKTTILKAPLKSTRSAPSTPKKTRSDGPDVGTSRGSKWSLSKLNTPRPRMVPDDGVERMYEVADEIDEETISEPPSKIRRIYGFMRRLVGWQTGGNKEGSSGNVGGGKK